MDAKVNILGIAPYIEMKPLMEQTAEKRSDVSLTVYVGDMNEGYSIASSNETRDFDVILSRGGTAELISSTSSIPVVEIPLSVYDILRTMKLAENYTQSYAVVGFHSITRNVYFLCDLLQTKDIEIHTIHNHAEVEMVCKQLKDKGCTMILCDMITKTYAQQLGMHTILFTSGAESMESAFDQAVKTAGIYRKLKEEASFFRNLLEQPDEGVLVYDEHFELVYRSQSASPGDAILHALRKDAASILESRRPLSYKYSLGGSALLSVTGVHKNLNGRDYAVYYTVEKHQTLSLIDHGVCYRNRDEAMEENYSSFYGLISPPETLLFPSELLQAANSPIIITGESGVGKDYLANLLYLQGSHSNKPLCILDGARINEECWEYLSKHEDSPLNDTETDIYIRNIEFLPENIFLELLSLLLDLRIEKHNHLIFTCVTPYNEPLPKRYQMVLSTLSCLTLPIPPLRQNLSDIPNISSLYINMLNIRMSKEIIGLEPDALAALQSYHYPGNYRQFKMLMEKLACITSGSYMKTKDVLALLKEETPGPVSRSLSCELNLNKTLEEINLDILQLVLKEEKENQSAAAKRLGISRTTLWRMLQKLLPKE